MAVRVPYPHVVVDPSVLSGSPCVAGTHVPVRRLWSWHRKGVPVETLLRRYPQLGPARVLSALAFAYDNEDLMEQDLRREQQMLAHEDTPPQAMAQLALFPIERLPQATKRRR